MGAWGVGNFENDDAGDWSYDLIHSNDLTPVLSAFSEIMEGDYLEAPQCSAALAAAEVVAALKGNPGDNLPDEVAKWVSLHPLPVGDDLVKVAKSAVDKIRKDSELKELWEDAKSIEEWNRVIGNLILRLNK